MSTKLVTPYLVHYFGDLKHYGGQYQLGMLRPDTVYQVKVKMDILLDITRLGIAK